jgi:hypothetical protein
MIRPHPLPKAGAGALTDIQINNWFKIAPL